MRYDKILRTKYISLVFKEKVYFLLENYLENKALIHNLAKIYFCAGTSINSQPGCEPRQQIFKLPFDDPLLTIIPRCLHNVTRCGGCCNNPKHVCVPDKVTQVSTTVYKYDPFG